MTAIYSSQQSFDADVSDESGEDYYSSPAASLHGSNEPGPSDTASLEHSDSDDLGQGVVTGERHPLEAHLLALELEESERPPV